MSIPLYIPDKHTYANELDVKVTILSSVPVLVDLGIAR